MQIYLNLGDLLDILALINNGINFILYCTMSKQFRDRFAQLFIPSSGSINAGNASLAPGVLAAALNGARGSERRSEREDVGAARLMAACGGGDKSRKSSSASARLIRATPSVSRRRDHDQTVTEL